MCLLDFWVGQSPKSGCDHLEKESSERKAALRERNRFI